MEKKSIFEAIPAIMSEMGAIGKNQKNQQQHFMFRGVDDVYNELQKHMAKHGVFTVPKVLERTEEKVTSRNGGAGYRVITKFQWTFYSSDGSHFEAESIGEAIDYGDKASNKAASIAHKYALLEVFLVPTDEAKDPDGTSHELIPRNQNPKNLGDYIVRVGKEIKGKKLKDIPEEQLAGFVKWASNPSVTGMALGDAEVMNKYLTEKKNDKSK